MTELQIRSRVTFFQILVVLIFGLLLGRLWWLQVVDGETYRQLADRNRFRTVSIEAPRGIIYERNGQLLVRNRPRFDVVIVPAYLPDDITAEARVFARLSELLQLPITNAGDRETPSLNAYYRAFAHHEYTRLPNRQVRTSRSRLFERSPQGIRDAIYNASIFAPYQPVTVAEDVGSDVAAIIEEDRLNLPGVLIETSSEREYLTGALTAHVLGYVGPIPAGREDDYPDTRYSPNDSVGLIGVEASYESYLHGIKGLEAIEVDVTGRRIRSVGDTTPAQPGSNLYLTLDLDLQRFLTDELQAAIDESGGQSAAAAVMDPRNGEILALVSLPAYDNNLFAQGISAREYSLLSEDEQTPLVNRVVSGMYPPGSTFKIVPAAGSLEEGTVTPEQQFFDAGILYLPNRFYPDNEDLAQPFYCWLRSGHEFVNAISAMAYSCDVYYYQVAGGYEPTGYEGLGLTNMITYSELFGYGRISGIDLPGEAQGLIPTPRWKRLNYAETWVTGDTYNMSIGQGFVLATPLQVLNSYAAVANGGTLYKPHLVREIQDPQGELVYQAQPEVIGQLDISAETMNLVKDGLVGVVEWGTAKDVIDVPGVRVAGKTGTAEFCDVYPQCIDRDGRVKTSHAWFVAYAPFESPEIAVVVFVYDGGEGSLTAAPVANRLLRYHFKIDTLDADTQADLDEDDQRLLQQRFVGRLLGTDVYPGQFASLSGIIVDAQGNGVSGINVELKAGENVLTRLVSGEAGQFAYNEVPSTLTQTLQVNLPDAPSSVPVSLDVSGGTRYLLEFVGR